MEDSLSKFPPKLRSWPLSSQDLDFKILLNIKASLWMKGGGLLHFPSDWRAVQPLSILNSNRITLKEVKVKGLYAAWRVKSFWPQYGKEDNERSWTWDLPTKFKISQPARTSVNHFYYSHCYFYSWSLTFYIYRELLFGALYAIMTHFGHSVCILSVCVHLLGNRHIFFPVLTAMWALRRIM